MQRKYKKKCIIHFKLSTKISCQYGKLNKILSVHIGILLDKTLFCVKVDAIFAAYSLKNIHTIGGLAEIFLKKTEKNLQKV